MKTLERKQGQKLSKRLGAIIIAFAICLTGFGGFSQFGSGPVSAAEAADGKYVSSYRSRAALRQAGLDTNRQAMYEGAVLLKKADGLTGAPLKAGDQITVIGKNSTNPVYSGTGSSGGTSNPVNFYQGLEYDGLLTVNPGSMPFFATTNTASGTGRPGHSGMSGNFTGFPVGEMRATGAVNYGGTAWNGTTAAPAADVNYDPADATAGYSNYETLRPSYADYDDAAVLLFPRFGGEGYDMPTMAKMINCTSSTYPAGTGTGSFNVSAGNWGANNANLTTMIPGAHSMDSHYMAIDLNEENAIKEASKYFDKVIVIINSASPIEIGILENYPKVTAYWIGTPGENGFQALPGLLTGQGSIGTGSSKKVISVNPSGGLADTYYRHFNQDPAFLNFKQNDMDYGHYYTVDGTRSSIFFVDYQESLYLGYRYYETRYAELLAAESPEIQDPDGEPGEMIQPAGTIPVGSADEWYAENVVRPFGFGLSYTTFTKEVIRTKLDGTVFNDADSINPEATSKFTVDVKVTNTGAYAGKEIVQLYSAAPYANGGIEKSAKDLVGFGKTKLLQPGESQILSVTADAYEMASYDWRDANGNGYKGYELETGAYKLYVARDAHDSSMAINFTVGTALQIEKDPVTGAVVENLYDELSNHMQDNSVMLSREDGFDNLSNLSRGSTRRATTQAFIDRFSATSYTYSAANIQRLFEQTTLDLTKSVPNNPDWKYTDPYPFPQATLAAGAAVPVNTETETMLTYEEASIKFYDMFGVDYNDPLWDAFLNQLTYRQMYNMMNGNYYSVGVDNIGKPFIPDLDGPVGFTGGSTSNGLSAPCLKIVSTVVIAATWNVEIAQAIGEIVGNEGLWGYDNNTGGTAPAAQTTGATSGTRIGGWYAPATNIHRTPFSGRNFEYFSEDGFLAGNIMGSLVVGAQKFGVYSFIKHFFLNDQETNRTGLATWVDEQALREIYSKPFEIAVKKSVAFAKEIGRQPLMAVMTAFNRIGHRGAHMDARSLQKLLRTEWGFKGQIITDYGAGVQNVNFVGGNDKFLSNVTWNATVVDSLNDTTQIVGGPDGATYGNAYKWALRLAAKNILFTGANSAASISALLPIVQNINLTTANNNASGAATNFVVGQPARFDLINDAATNYKPRVNYGDRAVVDLNYTLAAGQVLPAGLYLSRDGIISGTPSAATTGTVTVTVNINGTGNTDRRVGNPVEYETIRQTITMRVNAAPTVVAEPQWRLGAVDPAAGLGALNDVYLNVTSGEVFQKIDVETVATWVKIGTIGGLTSAQAQGLIDASIAGFLTQAQIEAIIEGYGYQTAANVTAAISAAMDANTKGFITSAQAQTLINTAVAGFLTEAQIRAIVTGYGYQTAANVTAAISAAMDANAKGFITSAQAQTLINTSVAGFLTEAQIRTIVTGYGYQTAANVTAAISAAMDANAKGFLTNATATTLINDLVNAKGYQTAANVTAAITAAMDANAKGFITTAQAQTLINTAVSGKLSEADVQKLIDDAIAANNEGQGCSSSSASIIAVVSLLAMALVIIIKKQRDKIKAN